MAITKTHLQHYKVFLLILICYSTQQYSIITKMINLNYISTQNFNVKKWEKTELTKLITIYIYKNSNIGT